MTDFLVCGVGLSIAAMAELSYYHFQSDISDAFAYRLVSAADGCLQSVLK
jgi:hypothetical protein